MIGVLGVIPARWASSRFPGKPLALLQGKPMLQWVWEAARQARLLDRLLVATDDERIRQAAETFGAEVLLTRADHASGTDRLAEVAQRVPAAIVVNIQGDEPLLQPGIIDATIRPLLDDPQLDCATPVTTFRDLDELRSPDTAKVVVDARGRALYFSRSVVPFDREGGAALELWRKHVGLYVYRAGLLARFSSLSSHLEQLEMLEQLRLLENGIPIQTVPVEYQPLGVDRPADLERAEDMLRRAGTAGPAAQR
ncbi:MAG: 3-deoxy-manno-octulosonate cytidylyltransferase [Candidatus Delongbacteria bacterium]